MQTIVNKVMCIIAFGLLFSLGCSKKSIETCGSVNFNPVNSKLSFSVCGGPVFYATHSQIVPSAALRDVGTFAGQNGYSIRAQVAFNLR